MSTLSRHPSTALVSAVVLVAAMAVATAAIAPQDASAAAGAYVDSVTFTKQDPAAAVDT